MEDARGAKPWAMMLIAAGVLSASAGCAVAQDTPEPPAITGRMWLADDASAAPGTLRVFMADGSLLMTSCVETYRIARWTPVADRRISWNEDSARIDAEIASITGSELRLRLQLGSEIKEERYRAATEPYLCGDLRR